MKLKWTKDQSIEIAFNFAAAAGQTKIVDALLDAGADIHNSQDRPLMLAAENGHTDTVMFLLESGADSRGDRAARLAAVNGHMDTARAILQWTDKHRSLRRSPPALPRSAP